MSSFYQGKRVLVTGGLGFIGSNLVLRLVELGADVTVVDSMLPMYGATVENVAPVRDRIHINFSDVRDSHSLRHLVQERDLIFSLAGQISQNIYFGRTFEFDGSLEERVAGVTLEEVNQAIRDRLDLSKLTIVKAGDFANKRTTIG